MDPLNLESENQVKNISVALSSSLIQIGGKSVKGFVSYDRTHKQTNRQTNICVQTVNKHDTTVYVYTVYCVSVRTRKLCKRKKRLKYNSMHLILLYYFKK